MNRPKTILHNNTIIYFQTVKLRENKDKYQNPIN